VSDYDVIIVGGGIVGIATARELLRRCRGLSLCVIEKEDALAVHQTGRNSGVIHAGVYYAPGSLKARLCREGLEETIAYCREHGLPYDQCGKLIVATSEDEIGRLEALFARGLQNGLPLERLDAAELERREPHIRGVAAVFSPTTAIVSYRDVANAMADEVRGSADIRTGARVTDIREDANGVTVVTGSGQRLRARYLIACAGLEADRLAEICKVACDFRIVAFRGEYFRLAPRHDHIVSHLIYPVPDPALPFLGVHLTRMIGGYVTVGPNAVLALAREGYRKTDIDPGYLASIAAYPGFRRMALGHLGNGIDEMRNSLSRRRYLALCQRYCPTLTLDDLLPYPAGVRAQAILRDGTMVHDFLVERTARTLHVCNAPSPAATSAMPIARHVVGRAIDELGLAAIRLTSGGAPPR
jgi:L-2-hydroxyglutarate oxidase